MNKKEMRDKLIKDWDEKIEITEKSIVNQKSKHSEQEKVAQEELDLLKMQGDAFKKIK